MMHNRHMADVATPTYVENRIRELANGIANMVATCDRAYTTYLTADREYDRAHAMAILAADGRSEQVRKAQAEIATYDERKALDVADAAYRYADRRAKALESELRAWQSVGASVRQAYSVAGRGEGA